MPGMLTLYAIAAFTKIIIKEISTAKFYIL
jgi:hypothetical protein